MHVILLHNTKHEYYTYIHHIPPLLVQTNTYYCSVHLKVHSWSHFENWSGSLRIRFERRTCVCLDSVTISSSESSSFSASSAELGTGSVAGSVSSQLGVVELSGTLFGTSRPLMWSKWRHTTLPSLRLTVYATGPWACTTVPGIQVVPWQSYVHRQDLLGWNYSLLLVGRDHVSAALGGEWHWTGH